MSHTKHTAPLLLFITALIAAAVNMRSPIVMIGSVADILHTNLGFTASQIGYLGALPMPLFALGALFAPRIATGFGLERVILVMTALLTVAVATRVWAGVPWLFIGTFILSLAIGFLNALTAPLIKKYTPNHIAITTGAFSLSMSVVAGMSAWMVVPMAASWTWQVALSIWAVFGVVSLLLYGLISNRYRIDAPTHQAQTNEILPYVFSPWRSRDAWYMGIFMGIQSLLFYTVASFLPSIGVALGMAPDRGAELAFMFQIVAPVAILLMTFLMRRGVSIKLIAVVNGVLNAVGAGGLIFMPAHLHLWSALMGFGGASIFTLSLMLFSLRTSSTDSAQRLSGMVQAVGYAIAFFGPLILGKLFEITGNWTMSLWVLFILMVINIGFGWLAGSATHLDNSRITN